MSGGDAASAGDGACPSGEPARGRARNQVWNAAGDYRLAPARLVVGDGDAALFANTVTGLIARWYGEDALASLDGAWAGDVRQDRLDELAWLGLGAAAVARELPLRPALADLREAWRGQADAETLSLAARLRGDDLTPEGVRARVLAVARDAYGFDGRVVAAPDRRLHLGVALLALVSPGARRGRRYAIARGGRARPSGDGRDAPGGHAREARADARARRRELRGRDYVKACFGPAILPYDELARLERLACTGMHEHCRLWVAGPAAVPDVTRGREFARLWHDAERGRAQNEAYFQAHRRACEDAARRMAHAIADEVRGDRCLLERGRATGRVDASRAWRADVMGDGRVFARAARTDAPRARVELLLDASGSRAEQQAVIASQAYVIARALTRCGIPVRVTSFCSVRDYTVLRVLCDVGGGEGGGRATAAPGRRASAEDGDPRGALRYLAGGMNRDGLALRAIGELALARPADRRLVVALTDAAPMDDRGVMPGDRGSARADYVGAPAVDDAAAEVRALRRRGVACAAVFDGEDLARRDCERIFGRAYVRVRSVERMADAVASLVIRGLTGRS